MPHHLTHLMRWGRTWPSRLLVLLAVAVQLAVAPVAVAQAARISDLALFDIAGSICHAVADDDGGAPQTPSHHDAHCALCALGVCHAAGLAPAPQAELQPHPPAPGAIWTAARPDRPLPVSWRFADAYPRGPPSQV